MRVEKEYELKKDYIIIEFDGVVQTTVYTGGMAHLEKAELEWRIDKRLGKIVEYEPYVLTAGEIVEQLKDAHLITMIQEGPLSGVVWQYGNYNDGEWHLIGELRGYA